MQFSLKSYLAIGLGIGAFGAFLLSRGYDSEQISRVQTVAESLEPIGFISEAPELETRIVSSTPEMNSFEPAEFTSKLESIEVINPNQVTNHGVDGEASSIATENPIALGDAMFSEEQPATDLVTQETQLEIAPPIQESEFHLDLANVENVRLDEMTPVESIEQTFLPVLEQASAQDATMGYPLQEVQDERPSWLQKHADSSKATWKQNPFLNVETPEPSPTVVPTEFPTTNAELTVNQQPVALNQQASLQVQPAADPGTSEVVGSVLDTELEAVQMSQTDAEIAEAVERAMAGPVGGITPLHMSISDTAAQQAVQHIEYGKSLSRRGAAFAARQEFLSAMRVIAEENDTRTGANEYSKALQAATTNLKEAEDFISLNPEVAMNVDQIVVSHRSKIVSEEQAKTMNAREALKRYLNSAQQNFDMAGGRNVVSAEALHNLGKLHRLLSESNKTPRNVDLYRAMVYHQTALMSNPSHHQSANELGVLMARSGQLSEAKQLFKQSLQMQPSTSVWQNLAKAHNRLGEQEFANLAKNEASIANSTRVASASEAGINWMSNQQFNSAGPLDFDTRVASNKDQVRPPAVNVKPEAEQQKPPETREAKAPKTFGQKIKSLF